MAILFNNQGLVKTEFRAGLALVRVAESSVTAVVYFHLGLFVTESESLLSVIIPCVLIGTPLGAYVIRRLDAETFRRICMSFDAWVVGFGLSRVLIELNLLESPWAYIVLAVTILIDGYLLYNFFMFRRPALRQSEGGEVSPASDDRAAAAATDVQTSEMPERSAETCAREARTFGAAMSGMFLGYYPVSMQDRGNAGAGRASRRDRIRRVPNGRRRARPSSRG